MTDDKTTIINLEVKEKVNEISLLLVMSSEQDEVGITMLCDLFDSIEASAAADPACQRLIQGWQYLKSKKDSLEAATFFSHLQDLVNSAVAFCEQSGPVTFIHELESSPSTGSAQSNPFTDVDPSFLPDFIENHRMQLDDFESWLLDCEFQNESGENVDALVKRYVHSLKGDSYSIGLNEVGDICHFVEDILVKAPVSDLIAQLMFFREWVLEYLEALTSNTVPAENAEQFKNRFKQACALLMPQEMTMEVSTPETTRPSSTAKAQHVSPQTYSLSGEMEIFNEFMAEALEHLGNVEGLILDSEGSYSKDAIDTIFRGIHSLKGGSAYFSFQEMTETSHLLENMLDEVRDGKRELDETLTGLVLNYIDLQKSLLASAKAAIAKDGVLTKSPSSSEFLTALHAYASGGRTPSPAQTAPEAPKAAAVSTAASVQAPQQTASTPEKIPATEKASSSKGEVLEVKNFVKVDMQRLDHLIDSIGEMVIYSSMLIRHCRELLSDHEDVIGITHRVEKFTRDLQDVGMSMRLVPIKGLFQKMSRLVFDTSKKIKKEIAFSMDGEDTELDRNLIDKLADPLMHMVRNALDHGVEPGDEREEAGKPRVGKVHLSASHSGGCILIKIQDDGRGLNPEKLLTKAREKGIISEGQKLSEQEIYQLIFAAGFSTAAVVSDISGRGVGMDVVRRNVEALRGNIHIESSIGKGTTFTIELPLTLAIVDGIEVTVGSEHLVIPSLSIIEFIKPTRQMLNTTLDRGETLFFRGSYLPIFRLSDLYEIEPLYTDPLEATLVVVENNKELVALMVDEIVGELSTVIKSLGALFSNIKGVSGCAVMPNGEVALIMDIRSLVQLARTECQTRPFEWAEQTTPA